MRFIWSACESRVDSGRELSEKLDAWCVDLDELNWRLIWQSASETELLASVERTLAEPMWVVAGEYTRIQARFVPLTDTIFWLDYPLPILVWRQSLRTIRRVLKREPYCNGNFETLSRTLSRESLVL